MGLQSFGFFHSLRFRLIASVVIIEVIMLSLLVWNNISIIHTTHTDRLRDTADSMIQQIATTSGSYMVAVDYATLEDYLKNIMQYKELQYIVVLDRDDNAVISLGKVPANTPMLDTHPQQVTDGVFDIENIIAVAGHPMGRVMAGFSLSLMEDTMSKSRNRGVTIAIIEIILTITVTVFIGLGLTRRLAFLSNAAAEVEAGNYSVNVPAEINDEVGTTATAFNRMVAEVSSRTRQLEKEEARSRQLLSENRHLVRASLDIQEDERKHLARELHDELGQCLTAIQADAELIRELAHKTDKKIETSALAIKDVASRVYNVVHSMMHRLRPGILDNLGLVEALKEEIASWNSRNPECHCEFDYSGELSGLNERININLYRITQECLTNITRHASATQAKIQLVADDNTITLKIYDNGNGFDMSAPHMRLGLIGVRERVESLNGDFTLYSRPDQGVSIDITLPIHS